MEKILRTIQKLIPKSLYKAMQPTYHRVLAFLAALVYRFPSRKLNVVFITGTKGKTSTAELVVALLEAAGHTVALAGTLRFKIGTESKRNMYKMTIPGRFFVQQFLRKAVRGGCDYAVIEMTSEGAVQSRHRFIDVDALIFTNLAPEHIESHGSYENYVAAKLLLRDAVEKSSKQNKVIVANADDKEGAKFLAVSSAAKYPYSLADAKPYVTGDTGSDFTYMGTKMHTHLRGVFNLYNVLAAATYAQTQDISSEIIRQALAGFSVIRGRVERVDAGQDFEVIVDYAHTPDSLRSLYEAFSSKRKICVLGNTGGGRDKWKRKDMAEIADTYCDEIILTDEDPYDEDPEQIVKDMRAHITRHPVTVIMDRRKAIQTALRKAGTADVVLITGKGTDPYIMQAQGKKLPWDDATVAQEELQKLK